MKFTSLLRSIILEQSRFEVLYSALTKPQTNKEGVKSKPKMSQEEFHKLVQADPTSKLNNVDLETADKEELGKVHAGNYVQWLVKNYLNPKTEVEPGHPMYEREVKQMKDRFMEDLYKVTDDLKKFDRFKKKLPLEKRDINKLTPDELYEAVKDFDLTLATTSKAERKLAPVHPGAKLGYEGDEWRVVEIHDKGAVGKEAACFYGGNQKETRWCTSAPGLSYFNNYIKDGPLYVVYRQNDPKVSPETGLPVERYQFHFPSNQFMDKDDRSIDLIKFLNGPMSELKDYFKPQFAKGLTIGDGRKLLIESFSSGALGKYIALYGLTDLFVNLPNDLQEMVIQNRDKNNIIIDLPNDFGRFKDLSMVLFDNCIREIPDSICECKKLRFISLLNNSELKSLPDCIGNLPSLLFVNFKGSKNLQAPESFSQRAESMGEGMWDFSKD